METKIANIEDKIFIENLDPALIRPGRVDVVELIGNATQSQIVNMFLKFFPDTVDTKSKTSASAEQFASIIAKSGNDISMAMLQGYFLKNKSDYILIIN